MIACCVCGGAHHALRCATAQRYIRQCRETQVSPPPRLPAWWDPDVGFFMVEITTGTPRDSWRFGRRAR